MKVTSASGLCGVIVTWRWNGQVLRSCSRTRIITEREDIAHDLWSYGEYELAEKVVDEAQVSAEQIDLICTVASKYVYGDQYRLPSGSSMLLSKAVALAAVEVLEGRERDLARKRRRPGSDG